MVGPKSDDLSPKLDPEDSHGGRRKPTLNKLSSNHHGNMEVACYPCVYTHSHYKSMNVTKITKRGFNFLENLSIKKKYFALHVH